MYPNFMEHPTSRSGSSEGGHLRRASRASGSEGQQPLDTFCPEAIIRASEFTFSNRLSLNLLKPCQSLASPKSGSTHTARLRRALR